MTQHAVTRYAEQVVAGEIVAGRLVRLACERHLRDLVDGSARGLHFDEKAADRVAKFFSMLTLETGKQFVLEPFQVFCVGSLFGWKTADGSRRFRTAYLEMGKGSGKTPQAAAVGLYALIADGEPAPEVYSAATTREQAGICFRDAKIMAEGSPALTKILEIGQFNLAYVPANGFFRPVSSEHRGLDGKRPHVALIDELHEHPNATVVDKIRAGTKGRRQALIFEITNSGYDRASVCYQHHDYSVRVLEGQIENDSWFAYVCSLDPCEKHRLEGQSVPIEGCPDCDDWTDEKIWLKANPALGVTIQPKYLREQVEEAKGMPHKANIVKRLNFCIWTQSQTKCIPVDRWSALSRKIDLTELAGQEVIASLDIGATRDFSALVLLFAKGEPEIIEFVPNPNEPDEKIQIARRSYLWVPTFWIPENPVHRDSRTMEMIDAWVRQGYIRRTPGSSVDYDQVLQDIVDILSPFLLIEFPFDRGFQGGQMGTNLQKVYGDKIVEFPQGIVSMNPPFRELLELIQQGRIENDGNPVMTWMIGNTVAETRGGLIKPSKENSTEKIDGVTAGTMALGRWIQRKDNWVDNWYSPGVLRD